jgi:hypothetical protein
VEVTDVRQAAMLVWLRGYRHPMPKGLLEPGPANMGQPEKMAALHPISLMDIRPTSVPIECARRKTGGSGSACCSFAHNPKAVKSIKDSRKRWV